MRRFKITVWPKRPYALSERMKKSSDVWSNDVDNAISVALRKMNIDTEDWDMIRARDITKRGIK